MSIPFALSIHNFIHSVGADCGFAAIIGLALVVILFFAHARETANLRDGLDDAHERIEALQQQLQQVRNLQASQPRAAMPAQGGMPPVAPRPGGASALRTTAAATAVTAGAVGAATAVASRAGAATIPSAIEGQGAPSLGSATKLIPDPALPARSLNGNDPAPNGFVDGDTIVGASAVAAAGGAAAAAAPRPTGAPEGQIPRRTAPPSSRGDRSLLEDDGPHRRTWLIVLSSVVALAVVIVILVVALGGGGSSPTNASTHHKHKASTANKAPVFKAGKYQVAVLNGTAVSGLAADVFGKLKKQGFKQGEITNAATQTETTSVVYYVHASDRPAANQVATTLGLAPTAVKPVTPTALQSCATSPSDAKTNCTANVIVSVGSDQANLAQSSTGTTG
jgi:hypothetical protein